MRTLNATLKTEYEKDAFSFFLMLKIGLSAALRFTDADVPLYYDGEKYEPRNFTFNDLSIAAALSVDRLTIEIDTTDGVVGAALLSEDARNREVFAYVGANVKSSGNQIVEEFFRGRLDSWELKGNTTAAIEAVNELIFWNKKALRIQSSTCPWEFKGTECGYSGAETWCDQSYERCAALANADNFGGFRFLPSIAEKEIWWGRVPA